MSKNKKQKEEKISLEMEKASQVQWERLNEDPKFLKDIQELRLKYNLPVSNRREMFVWSGYLEAIESDIETRKAINDLHTQQGINLEEDVKKLRKKYGIPSTWLPHLIEFVMTGKVIVEPRVSIYPIIKFSEPDQDGNRSQTMIITPDTDLNNSHVIEGMKRWQAKFTGDLPRPVPSVNDSRRLDWRPVWVWEKRHPEISRKILAGLLGKNPVTVRRKLGELDQELGEKKE